MTTRIRLRRDTAANWTSVDPVLAAGEIGLEYDTGLIKVGDGVTAWTSLAYLYDVRITAAEDSVTALAAVVAALPIATRAVDDSTDHQSTTSLERILGLRTGDTLTTMVLSANIIYAMPYEPAGDELDGACELARLRVLVTADGANAHFGLWELNEGFPQGLVADSGAVAISGGFLSWSPTFTPEAGKVYVAGILVDTSTTIRAIPASGAAAIGLDTAFGTAPATHYTGSETYGGLADFPTPTLATGVAPAIGATYAHV
jgi:hypothetical protein